MSPGTIALIIVAVSIAAWAAFMANVTIRKQRKALAGAGDTRAHPVEGEGAAEPAKAQAAADTAPSKPQKAPPPPPLTPDQLAVTRRQFLNRAWASSFSAFLGFFGMASLSFLWPTLTGGFGTKITVGDYEEILKEVGPENDFKPKFYSEGRFWLTYYEGTGEAPVYLAVNAGETKLLALYRKCVHLGCSVPHCGTSMLFECPCHGSKYRLTGEYYGGPAPRGLDRFPVTIEGGKVVVDTGDVQEGPPRGTSTWEKFSEPVGAFCVPT
ncbi:MAG TPA: Rieske 2Fe-2S domain-containing protein [Actinomycetota bacterium]|nr:Rieske 2Fe-2S domain-containing protein [Actinomycetota bacterium]